MKRRCDLNLPLQSPKIVSDDQHGWWSARGLVQSHTAGLSATCSNDLWEFDTSENRWTELPASAANSLGSAAAMPGPACGATATPGVDLGLLRGHLLIGGWNGPPCSGETQSTTKARENSVSEENCSAVLAQRKPTLCTDARTCTYLTFMQLVDRSRAVFRRGCLCLRFRKSRRI
eukprot:SAG31_NODE_2547_length_5528_cov_4.438202_2_plen_175_part_00